MTDLFSQRLAIQDNVNPNLWRLNDGTTVKTNGSMVRFWQHCGWTITLESELEPYAEDPTGLATDKIPEAFNQRLAHPDYTIDPENGQWWKLSDRSTVRSIPDKPVSVMTWAWKEPWLTLTTETELQPYLALS